MTVFTCVILLGGKGARLGGIPKALIQRPDGYTILEHLLSVLNELQGKIQENQSIHIDPCLILSIQANCHPRLTETYTEIIEAFKHLNPFPQSYRLIEDAQQTANQSTLDLIIQLLSALQKPILLLACDYPFLDADLLKQLFDTDRLASITQVNPQNQQAQDPIKVVYFQGHPLISIWDPSILFELQQEQGHSKQRKLQTILDDLPTIRLKIRNTLLSTVVNDSVSASSIAKTDKLLNLNDPKDLALSGCQLPKNRFFDR
jgi:molybdopterin-guanine dinucleotide biosynthesis protein A